MKITRKTLRKLISKSINESRDRFRHYYSNYTDDTKIANEKFQSFIVKGRKQHSAELQELINMVRDRQAELEANGVNPNLYRYIDGDEVGLPVDKLVIQKMFKGELPMDYDFLRQKMVSADRFASKMSSGKYGRLD